MHTIWMILLLWMHLMHFNQHSSVLGAVGASVIGVINKEPHIEHISNNNNSEKDREISNATLSISNKINPTRDGRNLIYDPNSLLVTDHALEGVQCITEDGAAGFCEPINSCNQYYNRFARQFSGTLMRRPWLRLASVGTRSNLCSRRDRYGYLVSGICCETSSPATADNVNEITSSSGYGSVIAPVFFIPPHSVPSFLIPWLTKPMESPVDSMNGNGEIINDNLTDFNNTSHTDDDDIVYDPIEGEGEEEEAAGQSHVDKIDTPFDFHYQWPSQQFDGLQFPIIHQWPPPLPTHPPSVASWPPPIPTHPPDHHYPTHPASSASATTLPPTTTKRTTTASWQLTTTTRRPSYPGYPSYPTYRPTTTSTTTTTKKPSSTTTTTTLLPQQCGAKNAVPPDQERIVGGVNASPHEFPWMAVLFRAGKQFCGGSLITHNHILTAAHCVARMTSWDVAALTVHLGDYNIRTDYEVKHIQRHVKRLVRHKGFDFSTLHNDIAILTFNEPVQFTYEIQPICLPTSPAQQSRSYSGQVAIVAGWGSLRENGPQPSVLQKVQIPIWTNGECARKYGRAAPGGIIESMICAGKASKDSCSGDSGGPMIVNEGGRYVQVGIVSWGIGCGKGDFPGVYTRVTSLLPWIYKNIK